jgi:hypothetical protein
VPRSLPVRGLVCKDQDGAAPSRPLVDKSLDTMDVFHDVVSADVLGSLAQERELFARGITGP